MGRVHSGIPQSLALVLRDRFGLTEFVETGTNMGETTAWAAEHFGRVFTSELATELHAKAKSRFADKPQVEVLLGESPAHIREIAPRLSRPLFWLDAHWSGGDTAGVESECPLLDEIAAIAEAGLECPILLIDDARLFLCPPPPPHKWEQWPDMEAVLAACRALGEMYVTVADDVFIVVPKVFRRDMAKFLRILYR